MAQSAKTLPAKVRVTRNGNSRTLAVPSEIARKAHAEPGVEYVVEVQGDDILYRRSTSAGVLAVGRGADRHVVASPGRAVMAARDEAALGGLTGWDF